MLHFYTKIEADIYQVLAMPLEYANNLTCFISFDPPYFTKWKWSVKVLVAQLCPTLCDHMDCILPGSSVHGILQIRILDWVAISFSMK